MNASKWPNRRTQFDIGEENLTFPWSFEEIRKGLPIDKYANLPNVRSNKMIFLEVIRASLFKQKRIIHGISPRV